MKRLTTLPVVLMIGVAGLALGVRPAQAALISYLSPTQISGDGDVDLTGTLDRAFNIGAATGATGSPVAPITVNSVLFNPFALPEFPATTAGPVTVGTTQLLGTTLSGFNGYGSANPPSHTLSPQYRGLLLHGGANVDGSPMTLRLNGLTPGQTYEFEAFVNDSRGVVPSRQETLSNGAGNPAAATINANTTNADGGLGQFIIGTFKADGTQTQDITFTPVAGQPAPLLNAFQLRVSPIPEPSTYAMMAIGLAFIALMGRRKRREGATATLA